jgi:hypothetical protein
MGFGRWMLVGMWAGRLMSRLIGGGDYGISVTMGGGYLSVKLSRRDIRDGD